MKYFNKIAEKTYKVMLGNDPAVSKRLDTLLPKTKLQQDYSRALRYFSLHHKEYPKLLDIPAYLRETKPQKYFNWVVKEYPKEARKLKVPTWIRKLIR